MLELEKKMRKPKKLKRWEEREKGRKEKQKNVTDFGLAVHGRHIWNIVRV